MPIQVAIQRAVTPIGGKPRRQKGAGRVCIALLIAQVRQGMRCPGVLGALSEGSFDLWTGGISLSILRQRHAVMGHEPPIVAVTRGKPVEQLQQRALLPGPAGTADQAVGEGGGAE